MDWLETLQRTRSLSSEHMYSSETVRTAYDTRCLSNVRSEADISQLNLPHGTTTKSGKKKNKSKIGQAQKYR